MNERLKMKKKENWKNNKQRNLKLTDWDNNKNKIKREKSRCKKNNSTD